MKKSKLSRRERSLVAAAEERGYQQSQVEHGDIEAFNEQLEAEVAALRAALALVDGIANREVLNTNAAKAILVGVANALPDAMRAAIVSAAELPLAVGLLAKAAKEKGAKP